MAMEVKEAIDKISEIHDRMAKSGTFRGYKSLPVFVIGLCAVAMAAVQSLWLIPSTATVFVLEWAGLAVVLALAVGIGALARYILKGSGLQRSQAFGMGRQFAPGLFAGFAATVAMVFSGGAIVYLPGIWTLIFGMSIFAMLPYLPKQIVWVGVFYLAAGSVLLFLVQFGLSLSPWGMGATFGVGNLLSGAILYYTLERERK